MEKVFFIDVQNVEKFGGKNVTVEWNNNLNSCNQIYNQLEVSGCPWKKREWEQNKVSNITFCFMWQYGHVNLWKSKGDKIEGSPQLVHFFTFKVV